MRWLIRLYPARWRERYGDEFDQLVRDVRTTRSAPALAMNLVYGAIDAHLQWRFDMKGANGRALRLALLVAGIVWLGLSVEIYLSNVVFPSTTDDDTIPVLVGYLCIFGSLALVGLLAARAGASQRVQMMAGLLAGFVIGAFTIGTFAVVDNVWLDIVSQQPAKITGFAESGAASMRDYINSGLEGAAIVMSIALGVLGALFAALGGLFGRAPATTS